MATGQPTGTGRRLAASTEPTPVELRVHTPRGTAVADLRVPAHARMLLVMGHGAGGDVHAPDLTAVGAAALAAGIAVGRVTQPYRVAGRRAPAPAGHLDEAFTAVVERLRAEVLDGAAPDALPLVVGGRSSGARVACRTALDLAACGVLALAFPLHPPGRPERSRAAELDTGLPTLVVNGDRDPFGVPDPAGRVRVVTVPGAVHDLRRDPSTVADAAVGWLRERLAPGEGRG